MGQVPLYQETIRGFVILTLHTEVHEDALHVRLSPFHRSTRRIPLEEIDDIYVDTYSAKEFGGWRWGINFGMTLRSKVYRVRGSDGVRIERTNKTDILLESESPSSLVAAVERAQRRL